MISGLPPRLESFLIDIARTHARAAAAQQQITSGFRLRSAADDPAAVNQLLHAKSALASAEQAKSNMIVVKAEVDAGSGAVHHAIRLLDEALTAGMQAASGTFGTDRRAILAGQLADLQSRMVNLSTTTSNGRYVFSGDLDGAPSYRINLESPTGVNRLAQPTATIQITHPDGSRISVGRTAQELFDLRDADGEVAPGNVFAALQNLRLAIDSGTDGQVAAALGQVRSAATHLNTQAAGYGTTLNRIDAALSDSEADQAKWKVRLSEIRDTDIASAILEMQQSQTQVTASLSAQAQAPRTSLFDFLR